MDNESEQIPGRQWRTGSLCAVETWGCKELTQLSKCKTNIRARQWNGKLSKRAQVRSTWRINQQGILLQYKTLWAPTIKLLRKWHTRDSNPHPLTPSSSSKTPTPSRNDDSASSWTPFLLHCHTLWNSYTRLPWWSRILNKQSAQCREQGSAPMVMETISRPRGQPSPSAAT